ncbi:MAG: FtsB family cell division protein [Maricaulaceae bacterium]
MERAIHILKAVYAFRRRWPVVGLCMFYFYLAFHAFTGNQGFMRWVDYEADIVKANAELTELKSRRAALETRADALRSTALDLDSLDIKAREMLFISDTNEYTIWLDETP